MPDAVPRLVNPTYDTFLKHHLQTNKPCLIASDEVSNWTAFSKWSTAAGEPAWSTFIELYGDQDVSVVDCGTREGKEMLLSNALAQLQSGTSSLYIKDWHLANHTQDCFYTTPTLFKDDWLNAFYCSKTQSDFRFVYAGAKGTYTPVHKDVYRSYSWSANVCGRKRWWFWPPEHARCLRRFPAVGTSEVLWDIRSADKTRFPLVEEARLNVFVVDQDPGQVIFVPSGWYHQVENLTACVSINHNWCNSNNIRPMFDAICDDLENVEASLVDVKEMLQGSEPCSWRKEFYRCCQDVIRQSEGWDWMIFWNMILHQLNPTEDVWNCPSSLKPPTEEVHDTIQPMLRAMLAREELNYIDGLPDLLRQVAKTFVP